MGIQTKSLKEINLSDFMLPAPVNGGFRMEGYWVWCGSVVKGEDDKYHMFASRWSKHLPMHPGWLVGSEIVRAVSDTPEGPYVFQEVVLDRRGPQYWDGRSTHNPMIIKHKDKYLLYYMGTTHPFSETFTKEQLQLGGDVHILTCSNQRIGLAISDSVYGPWERFDTPILDTRPDCFDNFMVNNPAPIVSANDEVLMVYKCMGYKKDLNQRLLFDFMKMSVATAPHYRGPYASVSHEVIFDPKQFNLEDPFIWQDETSEFFMIAKDMDGRTCTEARGGIFASSKDGLEWELHKNKLSYSRKVLWDDGVVRTMGNLERPFILFEAGRPTHMFFATSDGAEGLLDCKNTWNMVIPLRPIF